VPVAIAAWQWLSANGLHLLATVYFATLVCAVALAISTFTNSLRIGRLARESKKQAALLKSLAERVESQAERLETAAAPPLPAPDPGPERDPAFLACVREDIVRLQAELGAPDQRDDAQAPFQPDPADDEAAGSRTIVQSD
jgi:hypothetical protein